MLNSRIRNWALGNVGNADGSATSSVNTLGTDGCLRLRLKYNRYGACRFGPIILMFDDIHHIDAYSWTMLAAIANVPKIPCMIVMTMREAAGALDPRKLRSADKAYIHKTAKSVVQKLMQHPQLQQLVLTPLTKEEVGQLMQSLLPDCAVHESNIEVVLQQTQGSPVHVEEITLYIASLGEEAVAKLADAGGVMTHNLSMLAAGTISHVILSRTDGLQPHEQLTLKVCSVLGPNITAEILLATYPLAYESRSEMIGQLVDDLRILCRENFLWLQSNALQQHWNWKSQVARDVVYGMIPFNQRRLLHARLAAALDGARKSAGAAISHIAYHWSKSCSGVELVESRRTMNAIRCWKQAAKEMAAQGALLDSIRFMAKSLELTEILLSSTKYEDAMYDNAENVMALSKRETSGAMLDLSLQHSFIGSAYMQLQQESMVRLMC
jgi:predicted ATPase